MFYHSQYFCFCRAKSVADIWKLIPQAREKQVKALSSQNISTVWSTETAILLSNRTRAHFTTSDHISAHQFLSSTCFVPNCQRFSLILPLFVSWSFLDRFLLANHFQIFQQKRNNYIDKSWTLPMAEFRRLECEHKLLPPYKFVDMWTRACKWFLRRRQLIRAMQRCYRQIQHDRAGICFSLTFFLKSFFV